MNNFAQSHSRWLDPPEEPEAVLCEDCGEEMEDGETCEYQFCQAKFEGDAREMAEMLRDTKEEAEMLSRKLKRIEQR